MAKGTVFLDADEMLGSTIGAGHSRNSASHSDRVTVVVVYVVAMCDRCKIVGLLLFELKKGLDPQQVGGLYSCRVGGRRLYSGPVDRIRREADWTGWGWTTIHSLKGHPSAKST
jgi:hypothetical protein